MTDPQNLPSAAEGEGRKLNEVVSANELLIKSVKKGLDLPEDFGIYSMTSECWLSKGDMDDSNSIL